ncbi:MAG: precorrin-3B synthase [Hyphomicrobium sp.]|nr:MAG: precorrin-3B synthase [Hyphomicrobium sp.]PPD01343.1 MAG: precorrin-3B synthase [Hyphomicrobium sp.]
MMAAREVMQKDLTLRKGWCPSAHRPMQTGDGLLLRVRPRAGSLSLDQLISIADIAERHGSGEIDLTNRANLQVRGLSAETYPEAIAALIASGIVEADADAEAARNVVVDPLTGLDPSHIDVRNLASALEAMLIARSDLHALPNKFGFSVSGSARGIRTAPYADISIAAQNQETYSIKLDGNAETHIELKPPAVVSAVARLAEVFLALTAENPELRRMRDAVAAFGATHIFTKANLASTLAYATSNFETSAPSVGILSHAATPYAVAIGLPFGRITDTAFKNLASQARELGCRDCRLSQQRTLVFPLTTRADADALLSAASYLNLITQAEDPRLMMHVCPGAPSCANATTSTRIDAERLAQALRNYVEGMPSIHISGCEKGCAHRNATAYTFVARNGAYDLIVNGTTQSAPHIASISPTSLSSTFQAITDRRS